MLTVAFLVTSALATNVMLPGSGLVYSVPGTMKEATVPKCITKVTLSKEQAPAGCKLQIKPQWIDPVIATQTVTFNYYWKKGSSEFVEADMVDASNNENTGMVDCADGGDFYLGVKPKECKLCTQGVLGVVPIRARAEITTSVFHGEQAHVFMPESSDSDNLPFKSSETRVDKDKYMLIHFTAAATGKAHFVTHDDCKVNKCTNWWLHKGVTDLPAADQWETGFTDDTMDHELVLDVEAGTHLLVIKAVGETDYISVDYDFNTNVDGPKFKEASNCPQVDCAGDEFQNCDLCTAEGNNCHWCPTSRTCTGALACETAEETPISFATQDTCEDIDAECKKIDDCAKCVAKAGCVYCKATAINKGSCDAGKDLLGVECALVGSSILDSKPYTAEQCGDDSGAATVAVSMLASLIAALTMA